MPLRLSLLSLLFTLVISLSAGPAGDPLALTDPDERAAALDSLVAAGQLSSELFQALGNAHLAAGRYGPAVLAYRRGLRLAPHDAALSNNLRYARAEAGLPELDLPASRPERWWNRAAAGLGTAGAAWLALIFFWLAVGGATVWFLRRRTMDERLRFALLPAAAFCLVLSLLFHLLGQSRLDRLTDERAAVLVAPAAELRVAPSPSATLEANLRGGYDLYLLDENGEYLKVSLDDGRQGWLPAEAVERVRWGDE